jgi:UDP-N-acetylmuramate dehydrogenase
LKGHRLGDAQVSEKHANFIVNRGRARARDILALIELARQKVFQGKGVWLEMEIQVMGED